MVILFVILIIAGASYYFFVFKTAARRNADPRQQELARMLMQTAGYDGPRLGDQDIIKYVSRQGWPSGEARRRVAHAGSIARVAATPKIYESVKKSVARICGDL
jgi:hypothetical protein